MGDAEIKDSAQQHAGFDPFAPFYDDSNNAPQLLTDVSKFSLLSTSTKGLLSWMLSGPHEQFEFNLCEFIRTELETGITFASIALESKTQEKRQRAERMHARLPIPRCTSGRSISLENRSRKPICLPGVTF